MLLKQRLRLHQSFLETELCKYCTYEIGCCISVSMATAYTARSLTAWVIKLKKLKRFNHIIPCFDFQIIFIRKRLHKTQGRLQVREITKKYKVWK